MSCVGRGRLLRPPGWPRLPQPASPAAPRRRQQRKECHAALLCSDSLNISPRARWVVCPLGRTRGHGRLFIIYPRRVREEKRKKIPCSSKLLAMAVSPLNGLAAMQREEQGDLFIFFFCNNGRISATQQNHVRLKGSAVVYCSINPIAP